ncbi:hypothetical protein AB835_14720 [Candidatus Endobugula sertula]|uniref:Insecticide toxin TcdB middle/N-terminal domain-containing protein n=1 Tax=Candidatus Endobugula sertula TaxID=62101 RepID=A0A1D2QL95_9GAMM|nr:hypothetical protein AB835_14720 [Candidatus Endobugula sertula]
MLINCIFKKNILKKRATLFLLSPYILMSICLASLVFSTHLWASYNKRVLGPEWSDVNGWDQPEYYSTILYEDINRDGKADICGRSSEGIKCHQSIGKSFAQEPVGFDGPAWSDANGWNKPEYYSTIQYPVLGSSVYSNGDGKPGICGRDKDGIKCHIYSSIFEENVWSETLFPAPNWSDAQGWNRPEYFSTIRYPDLNGDGKADICARAKTGIICHLNNNGEGFMKKVFSGPAWSDMNGWGLEKYYSTIDYPDINGDGKADICGRSIRGIECHLSTGRRFSNYAYLGPNWSNSDHWDNPKHYSTIGYPDINRDGKADICGRTANGVRCFMSNVPRFKVSTTPSSSEELPYLKHLPSTCHFSNCTLGLTFIGPEWSDASGWDMLEHYSTIQYPTLDHNNSLAGICGRSSTGVECYYHEHYTLDTAIVMYNMSTPITRHANDSYDH